MAVDYALVYKITPVKNDPLPVLLLPDGHWQPIPDELVPGDFAQKLRR